MLGKHGITKSGAISINMRAAQKSLDQHTSLDSIAADRKWRELAQKVQKVVTDSTAESWTTCSWTENPCSNPTDVQRESDMGRTAD